MKSNPTTTAKMNTTRVIVMVSFLLLSGLGMFGQNAAVVVAPAMAFETTVAGDDTVAVSASATAANSTLNFVSWFMGTKQTPNAGSSTEVSGNSKKQMINSGIAPNRLLIKSFLKKASTYASTVS